MTWDSETTANYTRAPPTGGAPTSDTREGETDLPTGGAPTDTPDSENIPSPNFDFVKMSISVDAAFGCGRGAASATFLVCLLSFLLASSRFFVEGNYRYDGQQEYHDAEPGIAALQRSSTFAQLPTGVQEWIRQHRPSRSPAFNRSLPYVRVGDDVLVSTFKKTGRQNGLAVHSRSYDTVVEYLPEMENSQVYWGSPEVKLVGFPVKLPYTAWCGVFELRASRFLQVEGICFNSNSSTLERFPPVRDDEKASIASMDSTLYATNESLWVAVQRSGISSSQYYDNARNEYVVITLTEFNVATMEKTVAAEYNITGSDMRAKPRSGKRVVKASCRTIYWVRLWSSIITLGLVSTYLYRLDVSSCVLPACLALALLVDSIEPSKCLALPAMLLLACGSIYLLVMRRSSDWMWRYISEEMMVWALYSFLFGSCVYVSTYANMKVWKISYFWSGFCEEMIVPLSIMAMAATVAVYLNHPIFGMLGGFFLVIACLSFAYLFLVGPDL